MLKFWLALVGGLLCLMVWIGGSEEADATTKWPSVPGLITSMDISETRDGKGDVTRNAYVKYSYSVDGKSYEGNRVKVELSTSVDSAKHYPEGTHVTVFYNPEHPDSSVLETGGSGMLLVGFVGFCLIGFAIYALFKRITRKTTPVLPPPPAPYPAIPR